MIDNMLRVVADFGASTVKANMIHDALQMIYSV